MSAPRPPALPSSLRQFLMGLPQPAAALDVDLRYVAANAAFLARWGLEGADVEGRAHDALFPRVSEAWLDRLRAALRGASVRAASDGWGSGGEGSFDPGPEITASPWAADDGTPGGVIVLSDTSSSEAGERYLSDLFERSPLGLNLCRLDGLWVHSNAAFLDIIGYSAAEADGGLTYWQLTPRRYDAQEAEQLKSLQERGRYGPYEKEFIRKDGTLIPVRLNGFIVERGGEQLIWSVIEDLRAERALQQRLERERLKALQASRLATIGELAAGVAHEINNPLAIIEAYAFQLGEASRQGDGTFVEEAVDAIRQSVVRAAEIVRGLRHLARNEPQATHESVAATSLVEDAVALCAARFKNHGISLEVERATTALVKVRPLEASQVVLSLLNNAFDAVQGVSAPWVRAAVSEADEGWVEIAVEDSGPGIPEGVRGRLFEPFFTTKAVGQGTGLGLSVSQGIVESLGGAIRLDESAARTRFVVRLPRAAELS